MPRPVPKMTMNLNNVNNISPIQKANLANLAVAPQVKSKASPSALSAPIIARIHSVKPGCGGCGRH
jgi:hypothetical protein